MLAEIPQCQRQGHLFMAIFNPIAQKEQENGFLSLIMAITQKYRRSGETRRERRRSLVLEVCVCVCYVRDQNVLVVNLQL